MGSHIGSARSLGSGSSNSLEAVLEFQPFCSGSHGIFFTIEDLKYILDPSGEGSGCVLKMLQYSIYRQNEEGISKRFDISIPTCISIVIYLYCLIFISLLAGLPWLTGLNHLVAGKVDHAGNQDLTHSCAIFFPISLTISH
jgi:hypothetical protein